MGGRVGSESCRHHMHQQYKLSVPKGMDLESSAPTDSGQARLEALGYKQELKRTWGTLASFSTSFALMSCIMCITGACCPSSMISITLTSMQTLDVGRS